MNTISKCKCQAGYFMIYHERALHNYFIPCLITWLDPWMGKMNLALWLANQAGKLELSCSSSRDTCSVPQEKFIIFWSFIPYNKSPTQSMRARAAYDGKFGWLSPEEWDELEVRFRWASRCRRQPRFLEPFSLQFCCSSKLCRPATVSCSIAVYDP